MPIKKIEFVDYGKELFPEENTIIVDVGKKLEEGILDHHQPDAENECAASLVVKHPELILNHLKGEKEIKVITHRYPDFDAVSSAYLVEKVVDREKITNSMKKIAEYAKVVDSSNLPISIPLEDTPFAVLYSLFHKINYSKGNNSSQTKVDYIGQKRIKIGFELLQKLEEIANKGEDIFTAMKSLSGYREYEMARKDIYEDYKNYLSDVNRAAKGKIKLLSNNGKELKEVDYFFIINPSSYLLKDWIKRDFTNSPSKKGFSLLISSLYPGNFIIATSPSSGTYLKGLGDMLNRYEKEKREKMNMNVSEWYKGNSPFFNYRIIASPSDGTVLTKDEVIKIFKEYLQNIKELVDGRSISI